MKPFRNSTLLLFIFSLILLQRAAFAQEWEPIGPFGGTATQFATDTLNKVLYAKSNYDVYRSDDSGNSWTLLPIGADWMDPSERLGTGPILVHDSVLYVGPEAGPIRKSTDGGATWEVLTEVRSSPELPQVTQSIAYLRDTLYVTINGKAWPSGPYHYSADGGITWITDSVGFNIGSVVAGDSSLYAFGTDGLFKRNGYGDWTEISPYVSSIFATTTRGNRLFSFDYSGLHRAYEGSYSWRQISEDETLTDLSLVFDEDSLYIQNIHGRLYSMPIDGTRLTALDQVPVGTSGYTGIIDNHLIVSNYGFRYRLNLDTNIWDSSDAGWMSHSVQSLRYFDGTFYAITPEALFTYTDSDFGWQRQLTLPNVVHMFNMDTADGRIYAHISLPPFVYYSEDRGKSWKSDFLPDPTPKGSHVYIVDGAYYLAVPTRGLLRSTDMGKSWRESSEFTIMHSQWMRTQVCGSGNDLYIKTDYLLFRSSNRGESWEPLVPDSLPRLRYTTLNYCNGRLLLMPVDGRPFEDVSYNDPGFINGVIYYSDDKGETWHGTAQTLPKSKANETGNLVPRLQELFLFGDTLLVTLLDTSMTTRLFASTDRGDLWNEVPTHDFWKPTKVTLHDGYIYAGTSGRGVIRSEFRAVLSVPDQIADRKTVRLFYDEQSKNAVYTIASAADVRLELYSTDGRVISTLHTGKLEAGTHQTPIPTADIQTGAYLLVLRTETEQVAHVIFMK